MATRATTFIDSHADDYAVSIEELLPGLVSANEVELVSTALLLSELGPQGSPAVPALIDALEREPGREVLWAVAFTLGRIGPAAHEAVPALMSALQSTDRDVRDEAGRALDRILCRTRAIAEA